MADTDSHPIPNRASTWAIALDGGTTNTRARLLHGDRIIATARRGVGVRDTVLGDSEPARSARRPPRNPSGSRRRQPVRPIATAWSGPFARSSRKCRPRDGPRGGDRGRRAAAIRSGIVAAGMLSSEVGLVAVPHVVAPAGLDDLARGVAVVNLPEVAAMPIHVVPGVRTPAADGPDGWFEADVMRGEECETLGAYASLAADGRVGPGRGRSSSGRARTPSWWKSIPRAG